MTAIFVGIAARSLTIPKHLKTMKNFFEFLGCIGCLALLPLISFVIYFIVGALIYLLPFLLTVGMLIFAPYVIIKIMTEE